MGMDASPGSSASSGAESARGPGPTILDLAVQNADPPGCPTYSSRFSQSVEGCVRSLMISVCSNRCPDPTERVVSIVIRPAVAVKRDNGRNHSLCGTPHQRGAPQTSPRLRATTLPSLPPSPQPGGLPSDKPSGCGGLLRGAAHQSPTPEGASRVAWTRTAIRRPGL